MRRPGYTRHLVVPPRPELRWRDNHADIQLATAAFGNLRLQESHAKTPDADLPRRGITVLPTFLAMIGCEPPCWRIALLAVAGFNGAHGATAWSGNQQMDAPTATFTVNSTGRLPRHDAERRLRHGLRHLHACRRGDPGGQQLSGSRPALTPSTSTSPARGRTPSRSSPRCRGWNGLW